jgi:2-polyprenyl-3-methyl-5-hydroxy-6-metoxy-1,4-benzoquinol methylase
VHGVPRFTAPSTYADSFGFQWTKFRTDQLDSENRRESEQTFRLKTGLSEDDVRGRTVLDAGCGMGRFSEVVARWGAAKVVAIDLSGSVGAAYENLAAYESVTVVQADLQSPPLEEGSFDIVFSIGVLHHTPDTRRAFLNLAHYVKPGGIYSVWVYSRRLRFTLAGGSLIRPFTKRMEPHRLLRIIRRVEPTLTSLKRRLGRAAPLVNVIVPVSGHSDPEWRVLDTFDWYSPTFQWKHSFEEVESWFRELGYQNVHRLDMPVAVRGNRPV